MNTEKGTKRSRRKQTGKIIIQAVLIIGGLFSFLNCSNNKKNKIEESKKQDNFITPITILITTPVLINSDTCPLPSTISIPKVAKTTYTFQTKSGIKKFELSPPEIKPLAVLKNEKGEVIKDKGGNPFILGEGGISNFSNYTTENGLALDAIGCSIIDKTGNLWFGTYGGGISRYDGKSFTNYTTAQGLANNIVFSILEDKSGNLWFGTAGGGVSRYDGKSFTNFTTTQGLVSNQVLSILEDKTGNLWFGTAGGGVSCYDGQHPSGGGSSGSAGKFTNFTTAQGLADNTVRCITEDKMGNIWFGTYGGGVSRYDGHRSSSGEQNGTVGRFTNFTTAQGLANDRILSIAEDKAGNLWFGTYGGGVSCYDNNQSTSGGLNGSLGRFTNYTTAHGLANNVVRSVMEDKTGNLWFGTEGGGVSCYNGGQSYDGGLGGFRGKFTNYTTEQGLANNYVFSITEDKTGNLWFGTDGGGVCRFDGKSFTNYYAAQGLAKNMVRSIMEDKIGNIWFGTEGSGVSCYDGKSFTNYNTLQGLPNNQVWSIIQDKNGNIWFGTSSGGVCRYDGKSFTNYTTAQGLAYNTVFSIMEDKMGNLWFGTYGGGVSRYDGNRVEAIETALQRGEIIPQRAQQDLKKVNGKLVKSFTNYTTVQGLANNTVWSITEDKTGNIWFGTDGGGVSRYDGNRIEAIEAALQSGEIIPQQTQQDLKKINGKFVKSFTNYTTTQGLANNTVWAITEDKAGNLWFGTDGGGVSRYDGKSFMNFTTAEGLPDKTVTQVGIYPAQTSLREAGKTNGDYLVIGTNFGIGVFTGWKDKSGKSFPFEGDLGRATNENLKNYTPLIEIYNSNKGYPLKDVNASQHCMFIDSRGIIWAGTGSDKTALVRFDYLALNKNKMPPTVFIQGVKINNSTICWNDLIAGNREQGIKIKNDSTTTAPNITEEVTTFGKVLSDSERDTIRRKFGDIKFDGITKFYPLPENLVLPQVHNNITFDFAAIEPAKPYLVRYQYILEGYDNDWCPITDKTTATFGNIYEGSYTFKLKAQSPFGLWSEPIIYTFKVLPPWWRTWWMYSVYGILTIALIVGIVWWNGRRLIAKAKELAKEIKIATVTIVEQKKIVEEKQKEITDSINYAKRIQTSFLTSEKYIGSYLSDYFILFNPRDIVSGDFYWMIEKKSALYVCTADCTGHGIPGAFMSLIGMGVLNEIIFSKSNLFHTDEIFNELRRIIILAVNPVGATSEGKDGMDAILCRYDLQKMQLEYSAANNSFYIVRKGTLLEFKPDKMPVGKHDKDQTPFTRHQIQLQKGDIVYTLTDGFPDQFGGTKGKKYMSKQLREFFITISDLPMSEQKQKLKTELETWRGNLEQVDDVTIIGIRI